MKKFTNIDYHVDDVFNSYKKAYVDTNLIINTSCEHMPPCGVPSFGNNVFPLSRIPAFSQAFSCLLVLGKVLTFFKSLVWSMRLLVLVKCWTIKVGYGSMKSAVVCWMSLSPDGKVWSPVPILSPIRILRRFIWLVFEQ